jgi:TctA family transporter
VRTEVVHSILILTGTSAAIVTISRLAQRGRLSFRYAIGWLVVFTLSLLSAPVLPFMDLVSRNLHLGPASVFAVAALVLLAMIAVQLSISISGLQEQVRQLNEDTAFLRLQNYDSEQINGEIIDDAR